MGTYETVLTVLFFMFALLLLISGVRTYRRVKSSDKGSRKKAFRHAAQPLLFAVIFILAALWILTRAGWLMLIVSLIAAVAMGVSVGGGLGEYIRKQY